MPSGPRVLVIRFSSLGDVVLTTPLLRAIRHRHPAAEVTVVVQARFADLLRHNPAVNTIIPVDPREPARRIADRLKGGTFDARLDLQDSFRSRRLRRLLGGRWGVADRRRGARALLLWLGVDIYGPYVPVAERYFTAAGALDVRPDGQPPAVFPTGEDEARAADLAPAGCVALAPGARWASKRWPAPYWKALADRLLARGLAVVAVGGAGERGLLSGPSIGDAYGLPLLLTAAVLRRARVVVANDSGLMHLATAVRRPVVTILGPTVRAFGFLPYGVPAQVVERPLPCRPCSAFGGNHCPLGHHRCMIEIEPEAVAAAVERAA
jgi:heptosyltransferase-2